MRHWNGFSPVWVLICRVTLLALVNTIPHKSQRRFDSAFCGSGTPTSLHRCLHMAPYSTPPTPPSGTCNPTPPGGKIPTPMSPGGRTAPASIPQTSLSWWTPLNLLFFILFKFAGTLCEILWPYIWLRMNESPEWYMFNSFHRNIPQRC